MHGRAKHLFPGIVISQVFQAEQCSCRCSHCSSFGFSLKHRDEAAGTVSAFLYMDGAATLAAARLH